MKKNLQKNKSWFSVKLFGMEAEILIYDEIGFFGISAKEFVEELDAIKVPEIHVRINTPGGDFFDSVTIYNALVSHDAKIIVHIDGVAASGGSLIAMAGDVIKIAENAFYMIHDPWSLSIGGAEDHRATASRLDKLGAAAVKTYAGRAGLHTQQVKNIMSAETWLSADEAVEMGFADEIFNEAGASDDMMLVSHDLTNFRNVPEPLKKIGEYDTINSIRPRDLELALRDAGASKSEAKMILSGGLPVLRREADERKELKQLGEKMDSLLESLTKKKE